MPPVALICKVVLSVTVCTSHGTLKLTPQDAATILATNQTRVVSVPSFDAYWHPSVRSSTRDDSRVTVNVNVTTPYNLHDDLIARGLRLPHEQFGALVFHFPSPVRKSPPLIIKRKP